MASYAESLIYTFKSAGAIPANVFVKLTANTEEVALCTVAGEKAIGVTVNATTAAGQLVEVVVHGGAKILLAEVAGPMKFLSPIATTGRGQLANAGDFSLAQVASGGIIGDVVSCFVRPVNIIANE